MIGFTSISAAAFRNVRLTECAGFMPVHHNGTVRQMRTYIKFLVQPESMGSIIDAAQREHRHGSAWNWCV